MTLPPSHSSKRRFALAEGRCNGNVEDSDWRLWSLFVLGCGNFLNNFVRVQLSAQASPEILFTVNFNYPFQLPNSATELFRWCLALPAGCHKTKGRKIHHCN